LRAFWDSSLTDLDVEELEDIADDDWATDSQGFGSLNRERFLLAMFQVVTTYNQFSIHTCNLLICRDYQLCDIWTDFIDAETYELFLAKLLDIMSIVDNTGERSFRADGDIQAFAKSQIKMYRAQAAIVMAHVRGESLRIDPSVELAEMLCEKNSSTPLRVKNQTPEELLVSEDRLAAATLDYADWHLRDYLDHDDVDLLDQV
jgi:hypothetical protein